MADTARRSSIVVTFPEANPTEERMAAILVNRADDGTLRTYIKDVPNRNQPDPEIVALLAQSVEIANL